MNVQNVQIVEKQKRETKVIFCMPGASYSSKFFQNWTQFVIDCLHNNISISLSQNYDPVIYYARNKCLGGSVLRGKNQKPYDGKLKYDYLMWIDSDIMFKFEDFKKLLARDVSIVSGLYRTQGGQNYVAVKDWDEKFFKKNAYFPMLKEEDVADKTDLMEVSYVGFGFVLVKYGIFESLQYPWFQPIMHDLGDDIVDFSSEDASLCEIARNAGHKIYIDPTVRVGHEKSWVF